MKTKIAKLATATALATTLVGTPAHALFGAVCVPTLYNCMCTYISPCPVADSGALAEMSSTMQRLEEIQGTLQAIKDPQQFMTQALGGQNFSIPNMDAIGIDMNALAAGDFTGLNLQGLGFPDMSSLGVDLNGMGINFNALDLNTLSLSSLRDMGLDLNSLGVDLTGFDLNSLNLSQLGIDQSMLGNLNGLDLNSLGVVDLQRLGLDPSQLGLNLNFDGLTLPTEITGLADNLGALGIDPDLVTQVAQGNLSPTDFINMAASSGVDFSQLSGLGLSPDALTSLANGQLSPSSVLDIATNLGISGGVLKDIGITPNLLQDIANGYQSIDRIYQIADNAQISMEQLAAAGLDANVLTGLPGMDPSQLMGVLQGAGFDNSPLTGLGIPTQALGMFANGQISQEQLAGILSQRGLNPSAFMVPGPGGAPVNLGGSAARPSDPSSVMTVPTSTVPGMGNALASATGQASPQASPPQNAAMCSGDKTLVSAQEPPNGYGSDPELIAVALTGNNLDEFDEAREDAIAVGALTYTMSYGRGVQLRGILPGAIQSIEAFEQMMQQSPSLETDLAINQTISGHVMTAQAEMASVLTSFLSTRAAERLTFQTITPTPVLPADSTWQQVIAETASKEARTTAAASTANREARNAYSDFHRSGQAAIQHHNMIKDGIEIQNNIDGVIANIDEHEALKSHLLSLEGIIRSGLNQLYVDGAAAWEIMRPQLYAARGTITTHARWETSFRTALGVSQTANAKAQSTMYGRRVVVELRDEDGRTFREYSGMGETPYSYAAINSQQEDAFQVIPRSRLLINHGEGEIEMTPGAQLVGVLQYYLELLRREEFMAEFRRGPGAQTTSGLLWNELTTNAPECITGPIVYTPEAAAERPELFDISKYCNHLVWTFGDEGDFIPHQELGGSDALLWSAKVRLAQIASRTGGQEVVQQRIRAALDEITTSGAEGILRMQGDTQRADHIVLIRQALQQALADTSFSTEARFPQRPDA